MRSDKEEFHTYRHQPLAPVPFLLAGSGPYSHVHRACNPTRRGALRGRYVHSRASTMLAQEPEIQSASTHPRRSQTRDSRAYDRDLHRYVWLCTMVRRRKRFGMTPIAFDGELFAIVMSGCSSRHSSVRTYITSTQLSTVYNHLMPKDLPGFYWDEERSRYFPLSSRPKRAPPPAETITSHHTKFFDALNEKAAQKRRPRRTVSWHANAMNFSTESYAQRMRNSQSVLLVNFCLNVTNLLSLVVFSARTMRRPQEQPESGSQPWVLFTHFVSAHFTPFSCYVLTVD